MSSKRHGEYGMEHKFKVGDIAYLVENNRYVSEGKIINICGDIITFKFISCKGGAKVKAHRLFPSEESALASIRQERPSYELYLHALMA